MNDIMTRLGRKPLFFDGAMGTILQEKGFAAGEAPELWNLLHPKDVLSVHISYLEAVLTSSAPTPSVPTP